MKRKGGTPAARREGPWKIWAARVPPFPWFIAPSAFILKSEVGIPSSEIDPKAEFRKVFRREAILISCGRGSQGGFGKAGAGLACGCPGLPHLGRLPKERQWQRQPAEISPLPARARAGQSGVALRLPPHSKRFAGWRKGLAQWTVFLDCGGKRSATPLSEREREAERARGISPNSELRKQGEIRGPKSAAVAAGKYVPR